MVQVSSRRAEGTFSFSFSFSFAKQPPSVGAIRQRAAAAAHTHTQGSPGGAPPATCRSTRRGDVCPRNDFGAPGLRSCAGVQTRNGPADSPNQAGSEQSPTRRQLWPVASLRHALPPSYKSATRHSRSVSQVVSPTLTHTLSHILIAQPPSLLIRFSLFSISQLSSIILVPQHYPATTQPHDTLTSRLRSRP